MKEDQRKELEKMEEEDAKASKTRRGKKAQKMKDAYTSKLSEAAKMDFDGEANTDMTPEDLDKALLGAASTLTPDLPPKPNKEKKKKMLRKSNSQKKEEKLIVRKAKEKAFWDSLL